MLKVRHTWITLIKCNYEEFIKFRKVGPINSSTIQTTMNSLSHCLIFSFFVYWSFWASILAIFIHLDTNDICLSSTIAKSMNVQELNNFQQFSTIETKFCYRKILRESYILEYVWHSYLWIDLIINYINFCQWLRLLKVLLFILFNTRLVYNFKVEESQWI